MGQHPAAELKGSICLQPVQNSLGDFSGGCLCGKKRSPEASAFAEGGKIGGKDGQAGQASLQKGDTEALLLAGEKERIGQLIKLSHLCIGKQEGLVRIFIGFVSKMNGP